MMNILFFILLFVALGLGWFAGKHGLGVLNKGFLNKKRTVSKGDADYFLGLNFLLNDEPDAAVDVFIKSLEFNSQSFESHRALGALLRRRGKVDKSISIYQSLLTRPGLSDKETALIKIDLARSYISAGLLDRAERLLDEMKNARDDQKISALELGLHLYQLERDWERAIEVVEDLIRICPAKDKKNYLVIASHFFCELAEEEIQNKQLLKAKQFLKKAGKMSKQNVRVSFLSGKVEMQFENYKAAIKSFQKVSHQNEDYFPEVYSLLLACYQKMDDRQVDKVIQECMEQENPSATVLLNISQAIEQSKSKTDALHFLISQLKTKPSMLLMNKALEILGAEAEEERREMYLLFHHVLNDFLSNKAMYECRNCGFEGKHLHWLCPGCSKWGTIGPCKGVAGE